MPAIRNSVLAAMAIIATSIYGVCEGQAAQLYTDAQREQFLRSNPSKMEVAGTGTLQSNMYDLKVSWYNTYSADATGGALAVKDNLLIVVDPRGHVKWVDLASMQGPYDTAVEAPLNTAQLMNSALAKNPEVNLLWFRAAGAFVESQDGQINLYVSHHVYEADCFYFAVSRIDLAFTGEKGLTPVSPWKTLFKPQPCIKIGDASKAPFAGLQAGGRIVEHDKDTILVGYGDHEIDGYRSVDAPQDQKSPYGKMWLIRKDGSSQELFATGVRNPQGLFVDIEGRVWETEHGPQGGDELNVIRRSANYGWPAQTYGVYYGGYVWPDNSIQGDHSDPKYVDPVYAWIPSIAPTNITQVQTDRLALWKGDLLLATLKDQAIHRLRISKERVVYDERIEVGKRLRDIVSSPDGTIYLYSDDQQIGVLSSDGPNLIDPKKPSGVTAAATDQPGEPVPAPATSVFPSKCSSCHALNENGIGPALGGLSGRMVGKQAEYRFSADLAASELPWSAELFHRFVNNPQGIFPSAKMKAIELTRQESNVVYAYLNSLKPSPDEDAPDTADQEPPTVSDGSSGIVNFPGDPFAVEMASPTRASVKAYENLGGETWVGFNQAAGSEVALQQVAASEEKDSAKRFAVELDVKDLKSSTWMSLERSYSLTGKIDAVVQVTASLSPPGVAEVEVFLPRKGTNDYRIPVADIGLTETVQEFKLPITIETNIENLDTSRKPRIVVFLPLVKTMKARFDELSLVKAGR